MLEDFEFRLRTRTDSQSPQAILMNYLNSKDTLYPAKDMAMIALMSYWLPLAYQATGKVTTFDLEPHIRSCLYRLKLHQQYLLELLGESNDFPQASTTSISMPPVNTEKEKNILATTANAAITEIAESPPTLEVQTLPPTSPPEQLVSSTLQSQSEWFNPFKTSAQ